MISPRKIGKLGCLVLRIAETSVCCEMTKRDVSGRFTLRNKTETLSQNLAALPNLGPVVNS